MATRRSNRRGQPPIPTPTAAPRDPSIVTPEMIRDAEEKVGRMDLFERSEAWALQRTVLETRGGNLKAQRDALLVRVGRPTADRPAVTLDQLARIEGQIDENAHLSRFPSVTKSMWESQLAQMREQLIRQRAEA